MQYDRLFKGPSRHASFASQLQHPLCLYGNKVDCVRIFCYWQTERPKVVGTFTLLHHLCTDPQVLKSRNLRRPRAGLGSEALALTARFYTWHIDGHCCHCFWCYCFYFWLCCCHFFGVLASLCCLVLCSTGVVICNTHWWYIHTCASFLLTLQRSKLHAICNARPVPQKYVCTKPGC
jgi:hypothetical protein